MCATWRVSCPGFSHVGLVVAPGTQLRRPPNGIRNGTDHAMRTKDCRSAKHRVPFVRLVGGDISAPRPGPYIHRLSQFDRSHAAPEGLL